MTMRRFLAMALAISLSSCAHTSTTSTVAAPPASGVASARGAVRDLVPPPDSLAKDALNRSPRHGEFVDVNVPGDSAPLRTWVVYPERKEKAGAVIVISEIYGLSDWLRGVADQVAADGFIAVAPDLISGLGPNGGGTESAASRDDVVKLIRALTPEQVKSRLDAARAYAAGLPAANGKIATLGFCWGGGVSFRYAASTPPPQAAVVFYGASPDSATLLQIGAPVLGNYGGDDARVNATIEPARVSLAAQGKPYEPHLYEGAGHGFVRAQGDRNGANLKATREAWPRTVAFLKKYIE